MNTRNIQLIDALRNVWAEARVIDQGDHFGGSIEFRTTAAPVLTLFEEFEEIVDGQMFAFLDEIQEKINSLHIKVVFDDGFESLINDLQVFPRAGELSFRLADLPPTHERSLHPMPEAVGDSDRKRDHAVGWLGLPLHRDPGL